MQGFVSQFCDAAEVAIIHKMLSARFGKNPESFYISSYLLELVIKIWQFENKHSFKIWRIWPFSFIKNPLYWSKSYFFRSTFGEISEGKKKTLSKSCMCRSSLFTQ
jgi:hypothetical protein